MKTQNNVRFNIVDALIIIFIVTLLALTTYIFVLGNDFADLYSQKETITYTVRMPYVNADLSVGDTVYHWNKDSSRGTVTDIRVEEKTTETDSCVYVTVTVDARKIKTSYYINGKKIEEGTTIDISFSRFDPSNSAECIMVKAS